MTSNEIALLAVIIAFIALLTNIAQVLTTYLIARNVKQLSADSSRVANVREMNTQWQSFILAVLNNRELADTLARMEYQSSDIEETRRNLATYYIINVLEAAHIAGEKDKEFKQYSDQLIKSQIELLSKSMDILNLLYKRGYSDEFIKFVEQYLPKEGGTMSRAIPRRR